MALFFILYFPFWFLAALSAEVDKKAIHHAQLFYTLRPSILTSRDAEDIGNEQGSTFCLPIQTHP